MRPALYLNGTPVTLSVLDNANLVITSTDRLGVSTSTVVEDFTLASDRDTAHTFRVPEDLLQLNFTLRAKVRNVSQNKKVDLTTTKTFSLNHVDTTFKQGEFVAPGFGGGTQIGNTQGLARDTMKIGWIIVCVRAGIPGALRAVLAVRLNPDAVV